MIFVSLSSQTLLDEVISSLLNLYLSVISHEHGSRTRSKALRRWYLWVVHQARLPLLIHITVKTMQRFYPDEHLFRNPSGVDSSKRHFVVGRVTSLTCLSSGWLSWRCKAAVIVYSLRRSKFNVFLFFSGQKGDTLSRKTCSTRGRGSRLVFD